MSLEKFSAPSLLEALDTYGFFVRREHVLVSSAIPTYAASAKYSF